MTRNGGHDRPLRLDGEELTPRAVRVYGAPLGGDAWNLDGGALVIPLSGDAHMI